MALSYVVPHPYISSPSAAELVAPLEHVFQLVDPHSLLRIAKRSHNYISRLLLFAVCSHFSIMSSYPLRNYTCLRPSQLVTPELLDF